MNLLMAIGTAVLSLVVLLLYFKKKKDDDDGDMTEAESGDDQSKGNKGLIRVLGLIPAVAGIITFILTEDMSTKMQMVDSWTILMAVYLVVNIILAVVAGSKDKGNIDMSNEEI